jgi:hypothetical protein
MQKFCSLSNPVSDIFIIPYFMPSGILFSKSTTKYNTFSFRSINAIVGWVKIYLQTEQKKTDFKPETDVDTLASPVSGKLM